ncbi:chymotrypsin BII-like [Anoplophora glabripennis]|uniref:chymotrypsin BII-like n=1 Tax=Anoplophora glabripennis TaxID=217634 RepID=UPI000C7845DE|nr:chymotrypsin BII-like [Anoplophora glabripennis]
MWATLKICQVVTVIAFLRLPKHGFESDIEARVMQNTKDLPGADEVGTGPPHHVAIITRPANRSFLWCGGSIVSRKFILTAAYCLENSQDATINLYPTTNGEYSVRSNKFKIHPKWQPQLLQNDIALIELPHPLRLPDLNPIELSFSAKIASKLPASVYGWEKQDLRPIWGRYDVVIISNKDCAVFYGALITKYTLCAKSDGQGNGCHGSSGGALVIDGKIYWNKKWLFCTIFRYNLGNQKCISFHP